MSAVLRPSEPPAARAKHLGLQPLEKIKETIRERRPALADEAVDARARTLQIVHELVSTSERDFAALTGVSKTRGDDINNGGAPYPIELVLMFDDRRAEDVFDALKAFVRARRLARDSHR